MRDCGDREREQQCSSSSLGKKRRSKIMEQQGEGSGGNIARECTECGKKFWSWKALFGHMRCHPERQWRGINPPPNFRRQHTNTNMMTMDVTQEDHEVAACLLLLANSNSKASNNKSKGINVAAPMAMEDHHDAASSGEYYCPMMMSGSSCHQFECSSCNKVFGSPQALGGHRASHKNVKGCFANNADHVDQQPQHNHFRNIGVEGEVVAVGGGDSLSSSGGQHKCGICLRVFTTGQALGGHKRCHWDRPPDNNNDDRKSLVDLNLPLPPPPPDHAAVDASSSPLTLDLRLGL